MEGTTKSRDVLVIAWKWMCLRHCEKGGTNELGDLQEAG